MSSNSNSRVKYVQMPDRVEVKTAFVSSNDDLALHLPEFISGARKYSNSYNIRIYDYGLFVGFDTEWMSHSDSEIDCCAQIALLKLCNINGFCLLIELHRFETTPVALVELLAIRDITYVGVNISKQLDKLKKEYGLEIRTTIELSSFAARKHAKFSTCSMTSSKLPLENLNVLGKYICRLDSPFVGKELLLWLLDNPWIDFGVHSDDKQIQYVVFSAYAAIQIADRLFESGVELAQFLPNFH